MLPAAKPPKAYQKRIKSRPKAYQKRSYPPPAAKKAALRGKNVTVKTVNSVKYR
jgi:hypothetical protein